MPACRNPHLGAGKSAWLHGLFLRSCRGDSAVSPNIESLVFVSSSRPPTPLWRPTTHLSLVAPTCVPLHSVFFAHLAHLVQFVPAHRTSSQPRSLQKRVPAPDTEETVHRSPRRLCATEKLQPKTKRMGKTRRLSKEKNQ